MNNSGFDLYVAKREWKTFKKIVQDLYPGKCSRELWKQIIMYRKQEFPELCRLASLMMTISGSNSSVVRSFSVLSLILSDRRLRSSHDVIDDIMGNDKNWSENEREEIIERALAIYMRKNRKRKIDEVVPRNSDHTSVDRVVDLSSESEEETESDGEISDNGGEQEMESDSTTDSGSEEDV